MKYEEILPHLNKIATLYLKDNKRKVGWLFMGEHVYDYIPKKGEVYFVNVQKGRKLIHATQEDDMRKLQAVRESIRLNDIVRIRSSR
jgi:hypothetical protein